MKWYYMIFSAGFLSIIIFLTGCQFVAHSNTGIQANTQSVVESRSENILHLNVLGVQEGALTVRIPSYIEIPDYDRIENGWKIFDLEINQQTLIWEDGELVSYSESAGLNENEHFSVLVQEQGSRIIAKEIYGPIVRVWGRIEKVSEGHIVVQELKYTQSPDTLKKPTGRTFNMLYDSRTVFASDCSPESLEPGAIIQSTAVGFVPGSLLIQGISVYKKPAH